MMCCCGKKECRENRKKGRRNMRDRGKRRVGGQDGCVMTCERWEQRQETKGERRKDRQTDTQTQLLSAKDWTDTDTASTLMDLIFSGTGTERNH